MIGRCAVALLMLVMAGGAVAAEPDPCAGIDGRWRLAGHDRAHTTSHCVGSAKSLLCTLDTYEANFVRERLSLGRLVGPDSMIEHGNIPPEYSAINRTYRVVGCRVLTADDNLAGRYGPVRPGAGKDRDHAWYPGDFALDVHWMWCPRNHRDCRKEQAMALIETFVARKVSGGRWRLVDWVKGDVFPIQGHLGEPCRPEDAEWHVITGEAATTTSRCIGTDATPLCSLESELASGVIYDRTLESNSKPFLRYKVIDCKTFDDSDPIPGQWDPRPFDYPASVSRGVMVKRWKPGDIRLVIRAQTCNAADNSCGELADSLYFSHDYKGHMVGDRWVDTDGAHWGASRWESVPAPPGQE